MTCNLDDPQHWSICVVQAVGLGLTHAKVNAKPVNERELVKIIAKKLVVEITGRIFHHRNLRIAYGAAYNGIARMADVRRLLAQKAHSA